MFSHLVSGDHSPLSWCLWYNCCDERCGLHRPRLLFERPPRGAAVHSDGHEGEDALACDHGRRTCRELNGGRRGAWNARGVRRNRRRRCGRSHDPRRFCEAERRHFDGEDQEGRDERDCVPLDRGEDWRQVLRVDARGAGRADGGRDRRREDRRREGAPSRRTQRGRRDRRGEGRARGRRHRDVPPRRRSRARPASP